MAPRERLETLPLAARKDIRDNWTNKKVELEAELSKLLGTEWTVEADPNLLHAYASGSVKTSPGAAITGYIERGIPKIDDYLKKYGDEGKAELNGRASKHVIAIVPDDTGTQNYVGCDIKDGVLRIIFHEDQYGSWQGDSFSYLSDAVEKAAPATGDDGVLSFDARHSVKVDYEPHIGQIQSKIAELTGIPDIKLDPNWDSNFLLLSKAEKKGDWKKELGQAILNYFKAVANGLQEDKFDSDDMLREGFQEAVTKKEIRVNALETLVGGGSYNEKVIKDGVLMLNSTVDYWNSYTSDVGHGIIDLL